MTELQERWLCALESGRYAQGAGRLKLGFTYCCLGVACQVAKLEFDGDGYHYDNSSSQGVLPHGFWQKLGLKDEKGTNPEYGTLVQMNDSGYSFKQIAAAIRQNPANFFQI